MTYQLIKSYIYLDLTPNDPRVLAALNWVRSNYQFDVNPGMPSGQAQEGLFYYYQTMAKTFDLLQTSTLTTSAGTQVDWRQIYSPPFKHAPNRSRLTMASKA